MSFALTLLATSLMASTVLSRSPLSSSTVIDYEDSDVRTAEQTTTAVMGVCAAERNDDDDDRSSNLSYVMAVQNSSIWTEVRNRSLTIATEPQLDEIVDRPPAELSDRDLSALRRACHDGLKCVAVDQLMVLRKSVTGSAWSSDESVRMAVTRITAVITNYTTEYHSDAYRYEAVTESDDATKANSSVTAIVEDNRQLCQIPDGNGGTYTIVQAEHSESRSYSEDEAEDEAPEDEAEDEAPEDEAEDAALENEMQVVAPENGKQEAADDSTGSSGGNETITNLNSGDQNYGTINNYHINYGTVNDATVNTGDSDVKLTLGDDTANRSDDATANRRSDNDTAERGKPSSEHSRHEKSDDNDAGSKTGFVGEGHLNNGKMVTYNQNNGTINKGEFDNVDARNGVVNVGTVNTGPANYGTVSSNTNNGTVQQLRDVDLKKYASTVENMYVDVLKGFVKNGIDVSD